MIETRFPITVAAEQQGDALAYLDSSCSVTYRQLADDVACRSAHLAAQGVVAGDRVLWCPDNDYETLLNFWSLFALGAVACPISQRFPEATRLQLTKQLAAKWLPNEPVDLHDHHARIVPSSLSPSTPATIILSSGSTGIPKAIVHSLHAHIANAVGSESNLPLGPGDRWLWSLPPYHVSGLSILVRCASAKATVYGQAMESPPLEAGEIRSAGITHLSLVATQLRRLLASTAFPTPSLKRVLLGGSAVPKALVREAVDRGVPLHTTYGLTEMGSQVTTTGRYQAKTVPTSGHVLPYRELMVDSGGEILVRGETLCLGYFRNHQIETTTDELGWFHTGDRGHLAGNGELVVSGRVDNMFVSGGENIYPEAIEKVLLDLPGIEQAIVVPQADAEFGARPVAFVQADSFDAHAWEQALRTRLRGFEVPRLFLPWPAGQVGGIKPRRADFGRLANP